MKNYYNYINESKEYEYEKIFLELAHLDELEIIFDFIKYEKNIYYFYNELSLFNLYKNLYKNSYFYINYSDIWKFFESKFRLNYDDIQLITKNLIERHFKLKDITTYDGNMF